MLAIRSLVVKHCTDQTIEGGLDDLLLDTMWLCIGQMEVHAQVLKELNDICLSMTYI